MEKELRKCENPSGTWVRLGNGELWCVSALPLGSGCDIILDSLEALYVVQEKIAPEKETAIETIKRSKELLLSSASFAYQLLRINYPNLTKEAFDENNLVTLHQSNIFQRIVQGGTGLGEIIGGSELGEAITATE